MTTLSHARRLLSAVARAADSSDPLDALASSRQLLVTLMDARTEAVAQARLNGATWAEIGEALGVSKQAAQRKYGTDFEKKPPKTVPSDKTSHYEQRDLNGALLGYLVKVPGPAPILMEPAANPHPRGPTSPGTKKRTSRQQASSESSLATGGQLSLTVVNSS